MAVFTSIVLAYLVGTTPVFHVRLIDKFSNLATCNEVIAKITEAEKNEPVEQHIAPRLNCIAVSYAADADDDGPSKPVNAPANVPVERSPYPCRNKISKQPVLCKEA